MRLSISEARDYLLFSNLAYMKESLIKQEELIPPGWKFHRSQTFNPSGNVIAKAKYKVVESSRASSKYGHETLKKYFNTKYLNCYIFINEDAQKIIFAFKGTVITDISTLFVDRDILTGSFYSLEKDVKWLIKEIANKYPNFSFSFTGHSLGGYMASRAAIYCDIEQIPNQNLGAYTFDSPGVDSILPTTKATIRNIIIQPNLINCVNQHRGEVYYVKSSIDTTATSDAIIQAMRKTDKNLLVQDANSLFKYFSGAYVLRPLTKLILTRVLPINAKAADHVFDWLVLGKKYAEEFTKFVVQVQSENDKYGIERELKVKHTLKVHNIRGFIAKFNDPNAELVPLTTRMPTIGEFCDSDDVQKLVIQFLEKNPSIPKDNVSEPSTSSNAESYNGTITQYVWTWAKFFTAQPVVAEADEEVADTSKRNSM